MRKVYSRILIVILLFLLCGCASKSEKKSEDIVILYTNDVHCGIEEHIGYAGLAAYKNYCEEHYSNVTLVDCGDFMQGDVIGAVSKGEYMINIMNEVGYDYVILGNHEFDYGMDQLSACLKKLNAKKLGCNITYSGNGNNAIETLLPYDIVSYGKSKVAFIGVSTPWSITSSTPKYFMEEGAFVYDFHASDAEEFAACVQSNVDYCREQGADYVILLTHLGDIAGSEPYSSVNLIQETEGIDVVLDGHAHNVIPYRVEKNKNGQSVVLSSTGTKLANIGELIISDNGILVTTLLSGYSDKDETVDVAIQEIKKSYEQEMGKVIASSDRALSCVDEAGIRLVRNQETAIGDFCADAFREIGGADIGFMNGGGIRADLPKGDLTYKDIVAVQPYGNSLCVVEATGQDILDALELGCSVVTSQSSKDGNAEGEFGGFLQVSGVKFTVDTSIPCHVILDENGMFQEVAGQRRVQDVMVQNEQGEFEEIKADQTYLVAGSNYLLGDGGNGYSMFTDASYVIQGGMTDYQVLATYLNDFLAGELGTQYAAPQGRITIK